MDNDNKIEKDELAVKTHSEVLLFLNDELEKLQQDSKKKSYNLEEEFAKTKKNKSPFVGILLAVCFLCVGGIAFVMNSVIVRHNQEIKVDLQNFDDLNLKTLLDSVSKVQANYDEAVKNKVAVQSEMETKFSQALSTKEDLLFVMESSRMTSREKELKRKELEKDYESQIRTIRESYEPQLAAIDSEIKTYSDQLAQFDTAKVESAREQEKALDAERQIQAIERQKIIDDYESKLSETRNSIVEIQKTNAENLRKSVNQLNQEHKLELAAYDPVINDELADSIIESVNQQAAEVFDSVSIKEKKNVTDDKFLEAIKDFQKLYDDYSYLDQKLAALPQKNSIVQYRKTSDSLVNEMGTVLVESNAAMVEDKKQLRNQISDYKNQISDYREEISGYKEQIEDFGNQLENEYTWFGDCLEGILAFANTNAVVLQVNDYDDTAVYVAKKARYLIPEDTGIGAEIRSQKSIRGRIYREVSEDPDDDDYFYFVPDRDRNGNRIEIDFETITPGTAIKLLSK